MFRRIALAISLLAGSVSFAGEFPEKSVATVAGTSTCQSGVILGRVLIQCTTTSYVRLRETNTGTAQTAASGVTVMPGAFYYTEVKQNMTSFCATADATAGTCALFSVK